MASHDPPTPSGPTARFEPTPAPSSPPSSEQVLADRARSLAGRDLAWVASRCGWPVPDSLRRDKGWVGHLLEHVLGATASSRAEPDFPHLGVELKTLPVRPDGRPRQSTYVCTAPLDGTMARSWEDAWVRGKLSRVLWVPILFEDGAAVGERRIGTPYLWSPSEQEEAQLRADWESLRELIATGELWHLDARHGQALQLRPKGARASERQWILDQHGELVRDTRRGFYLRPSFTGAVLARALRVRW